MLNVKIDQTYEQTEVSKDNVEILTYQWPKFYLRFQEKKLKFVVC